MRARKVITTILLLRQGIVGRRAKARGGTRHVDQRRAKIGACHAAEPLGLTVPQAQCTNKWGKIRSFFFSSTTWILPTLMELSLESEFGDRSSFFAKGPALWRWLLGPD